MQPRKNDFIQLLETKSIYFFGCLACILIFFQASFAFNKVAINLNLADIFAIGATSIFILEMRNKPKVNFLIPHVLPFMVLALGAFIFALVNGIFKFGFTNYAFISKFLGLFILIGYAALGVAYKAHFGLDGTRLLIKIMLTTLAIILLVELSINMLYYARMLSDTLFFNPTLSGYANNRNAFALQLLCVASIALIYFKNHNLFIAVMFTGLVFTFSRSAFITAAILIFVACITRIIDLKRMCKILALTALMTTAIYTLRWVAINAPQWFVVNAHDIPSIPDEHLSWNMFSYASSNTQRLYTLQESFRLWLQHPIDGIGLGGFVAHELAKNQLFLVIHNTFLWVLVEFGLIGTSVFVWYGITLCKFLLQKIKVTGTRLLSSEHQALLLLMIIFGGMGNAHEMFYQRILWLIAGLLIVIPSEQAQSIQSDPQVVATI